MPEIVVTLSTQPSVEEWCCIREFKRRAREIKENSLINTGFELKANMSWNAGEGPSFKVTAIPPEEPFRALLLTFRLFWANDEPSNFLRVLKVLKRHLSSSEARDVLEALKIRWNQALFGGVMQMSFNGKELNANAVFDLWLNAHYFHSDPKKQKQLERLSNTLSPEIAKFLLVNALTECCKAILVLDQSLQRLSVPDPAI